MNRILALQGLAGSSLGDVVIAASGESNNCSSETTACSTESYRCKELQALIAW